MNVFLEEGVALGRFCWMCDVLGDFLITFLVREWDFDYVGFYVGFILLLTWKRGTLYNHVTNNIVSTQA